MPDDRWRALGLGRQPAGPPRVPGDPGAAMEGFLGRLGSLLGTDQPSLASRMQDLSRVQRTRLPDGTAPGPPMPGTPEFDAAVDVAGAFDFLGPIKAYHGSPHTFDAFSLGKVGTGEGAQAYGHGLYFAENPEVAKEYMNALSDADWFVEGKPYDAKNPAHFAAATLKEYSSPDEAVRNLQRQIDQDRQINASWARESVAKKREVLKAIKKGKVPELVENVKGATYTVNLAIEPEDLLDLNVPFSKQPEKVRKALRKIEPFKTQRISKSKDYLGEHMYDSLRDYYASQRAASEQLRAVGIPGLRYLDQGSRAGGEGTRNFVLFDEALAEILERNGQPVTRKK